MKHLSSTPLLDRLLGLTANIKLGWKKLAKGMHYYLFCCIISNEEKSFVTLALGPSVMNLFASIINEYL